MELQGGRMSSARRCWCGHKGRDSHSGGEKEGWCLYCNCAQFNPDSPSTEPIDYDTEYRKSLRKRQGLRRWRANLGGYFWLPCDICGEYFGGHEWKDRGGCISSIPTDEVSKSRGICPACTVEGRGWSTMGFYPVREW